MDNTITSPSKNPSQSGLSYKFQRLREKLRHAVITGEFVGKLPGERALAKRFHVNAKTLSKALTDLAAEGLLDRSIGRGTYVKGHGPGVASLKRWLIVCDADQTGWELIQMLRATHPDLDVVTDVSSIRPSFLNQFSAVIDMATSTPDAFLRDLVVRNIPIVVVGREPRTYSTHAVVFDAPLAVSHLGRDLFLGGHRRLAVVEQNQTIIVDALRTTFSRYSPDAKIETCAPSDVTEMAENGITAFVCENIELAGQVKRELDKLGISIPGRISLTALGAASNDHPCSGYFVDRSEEVKAITQLLADSQTYRPTTLWLVGKSVDRGTICPVPAGPTEGHMRYGSATA